MLVATCLLGWVYVRQYQEEHRKSQRIPEPGQFILHDFASWIPSPVINNCRFFVSHGEKPAHKEASSPFADSPIVGVVALRLPKLGFWGGADLGSDHLA
jgi:hypothetical protein